MATNQFSDHVQIFDDIDLIFGTDSDATVRYDEATDNRVEFTGSYAFIGDLAIDGGDLTTAATTFNLVNATATTVNIAGAGTTVSIGAATGDCAINNETVTFGFGSASNLRWGSRTIGLNYMQNQTSGERTRLELWSKDGDDTDAVEVYMFSLGTPAATTNLEFLGMGWDVSNTRWYIAGGAAGGGGTQRQLRLYTGTNTSQLVLTTAGEVGVGATAPDAMFEVEAGSAYGKQAMVIDQDDADQAFIDFQGTSAANAANNLTSWTTGNTVQGHLRIEINGTVRWLRFYDAPTS